MILPTLHALLPESSTLLPKSVHRRAKKAIREITEAQNKSEAEKAVKELAEGGYRDQAVQGG